MNALSALLWSSVGAVVLAFIFTSAFLRTFALIPMGAFEAVILGPLICGFVVGALLSHLDLQGVAYSALLMAIMAMVIIYATMFLPLLTGSAQTLIELPTTDQERQAMILSSLFLTPFIMMGVVVGKAFGEVALPSDEEVESRRRLLVETREWHEQLRRLDGGSSPPDDGGKDEPQNGGDGAVRE